MLQFQDPFAALLAAESAISLRSVLGVPVRSVKEINEIQKPIEPLQQAKESRP